MPIPEALVKKVLKGLECCIELFDEQMCERCPYTATPEDRKHLDWDCHRDELKADAVRLLKSLIKKEGQNADV